MSFSDRPMGWTGPPEPSQLPKSAVRPLTQNAPYVAVVNRVLRLPTWHAAVDQGAVNGCTGYTGSMVMSIFNRVVEKRYDEIWLYRRGQIVDGDPNNDAPGNGMGGYLFAVANILRDEGHVVLGQPQTPVTTEGIASYVNAAGVDHIRTAISQGTPVMFGTNWYTNFDSPVQFGTEIWIGRSALGTNRGGHALTIYGASDKRQAFKLKNQWGAGYPPVWIPYSVVQTLISGGSTEIIIPTDK